MTFICDSFSFFPSPTPTPSFTYYLHGLFVHPSLIPSCRRLLSVLLTYPYPYPYPFPHIHAHTHTHTGCQDGNEGVRKPQSIPRIPRYLSISTHTQSLSHTHCHTHTVTHTVTHTDFHSHSFSHDTYLREEIPALHNFPKRPIPFPSCHFVTTTLHNI